MTRLLETTVDKFIFKVAADRLYSPDGVWVLAENGRVRLGVTDDQQQLNGDVAFVHLKPIGTVLAAGDELAEVETVKATVSLRAPLAGTIVETNGKLELSPEHVNQEPYGVGWLALIEPADWPAARTALLDAPEYLSAVKARAEQELSK